MDSSVPIVHLGFLEKPRNKLCTKALYFPSFIGGEPAFICKEKFIPDMTVCQRCNSRMTFIGQIYCPIDENPEAFHRMIYIYACLKGKCQASSEAVRVFRCQLPQANNYFNKQSPNYSLLDMTDKQLEAKMKDVVEAIMQKDSQYEIACKIQHQSKKLSSVYLIEIDTESEKLTKNILKKLKLIEKGEEDLDAYDSDDSQILTSKDQELIDKFNQEEDKIDPNEEGDVINKYIKNEGIAEADVEKAKELLTNFDEEKDETIDDLAKEFDKQNDENLNKEFEVFLEATKENSSQVIRYCRKDMLPLWSSKKNKLSRTDVPECEYCGSKRAYELQLMPAIYINI